MSLLYAGTAVHPPPEFVLAEVLNKLVDRVEKLESRLAELEASRADPKGGGA